MRVSASKKYFTIVSFLIQHPRLSRGLRKLEHGPNPEGKIGLLRLSVKFQYNDTLVTKKEVAEITPPHTK